jgi:hypothetical protein
MEIEGAVNNCRHGWQPVWREAWPNILCVLDDILQVRYRVKTTHILRGEKGTTSSYQSSNTGITTIIEDGEVLGYGGVLNNSIEYSLRGSSAEVISGLSGDHFDFFIKDQNRLPNSKHGFDQIIKVGDSEFGVDYFMRTLPVKDVLSLNSREVTLYHAIVTRALELDVKRVSEFFNLPSSDTYLTEYLWAAEKRVRKDYTLFLLNILHDYSLGMD